MPIDHEKSRKPQVWTMDSIKDRSEVVVLGEFVKERDLGISPDS